MGFLSVTIFFLQMSKNKFRLSQRKQHRCSPSSGQSGDGSKLDCGMQTDDIVTESVGTQTDHTRN